LVCVCVWGGGRRWTEAWAMWLLWLRSGSGRVGVARPASRECRRPAWRAPGGGPCLPLEITHPRPLPPHSRCALLAGSPGMTP
jgi:hypothetical protein